MVQQSALPASIHNSLNFVMKYGWFKGLRLIDIYMVNKDYLHTLATHWKFDQDVPRMAKDTLSWAPSYIKT